MTGLDARVRLAGCLALSVAVAVCRGWPAAWLGLALGAASLSLGPRGFAPFVRRLCFVNVFFLGVAATAPLSVPGEALFHVGPLAFSREGLMAGLHMALKGNAVFLIFRGLAAPVPPERLGQALSGLGVPDRLCLVLALCTRYLGLMRLEWERLFTAARLRGFDPSATLRAWKIYALMLALLLMRALDRARCVHQAMLCRGFDGRFRGLDPKPLGAADLALCLACLAGTAGVAFLEYA
ncbi:Energy-coupling factor transporter transmembrane protein EcfT [Fundidesulfovibrio magnetotacticus]|uniref:Energy-coupling factor transporter transmembrane protein EcfT n=1 Tax=Fundidesulfovibrio magnetotacticus TaxID=2730080 RepID=A0A6V8LQ19_9BACT|nr:energy-coupling factor transporter transmembrane component T [Fundidesulfovibrio magnetotacticus]GFK94642.1 Energy-coupling factor transporter transmembrane protein EcfT [Fundidesulfovibrio magnetotacticus]